MNKGQRDNIVIALLVAIALFLIFRYILPLRRERIILELERQNLLQTLEKEKERQRALMEENLRLKTQLTSVPELKKALWELRKQVGQVQVEIDRKNEGRETPEGNKGFLVKDGKFSYPSQERKESPPASGKE